MYSSGGGGQTYFQGGGVELLIDRTKSCNLNLTPVPPLDPRNYHEFYLTMRILFLAVFHHVPAKNACFTLI